MMNQNVKKDNALFGRRGKGGGWAGLSRYWAVFRTSTDYGRKSQEHILGALKTRCKQVKSGGSQDASGARFPSGEPKTKAGR